MIVSMQDFVHELPLKEYAKINFGESLVSAKTSPVLGYACSAVKIEKLKFERTSINRNHSKEEVNLKNVITIRNRIAFIFLIIFLLLKIFRMLRKIIPQ